MSYSILSDTVKFGNLGITVIISKNPELKVSGDLTVALESQQPLVLTGALYATPLTVGGVHRDQDHLEEPIRY